MPLSLGERPLYIANNYVVRSTLPTVVAGYRLTSGKFCNEIYFFFFLFFFPRSTCFEKYIYICHILFLSSLLFPISSCISIMRLFQLFRAGIYLWFACKLLTTISIIHVHCEAWQFDVYICPRIIIIFLFRIIIFFSSFWFYKFGR